jgi:hypothetical protein
MAPSATSIALRHQPASDAHRAAGVHVSAGQRLPTIRARAGRCAAVARARAARQRNSSTSS